MQDVNTQKEVDMSKFKSNLVLATLDIETAPLSVSSWSAWAKNWRAIEVVQEWYMLSYSIKFLGKKAVCHALPDFKGYTPNIKISKDRRGRKITTITEPDDKALLQQLKKDLEGVDIIIGHNSKRFDMKKINARLMVNHIDAIVGYRQIDTLVEVKRIATFTSHKLDDICQVLGIGKKVEHTGFSLWRDCIMGKAPAWKLLKKYNNGDVNITEKLYLFIRPYMISHPSMVKRRKGDPVLCQACGSSSLHKRGFGYSGILNLVTKQLWRCNDCDKTTTGDTIKE